MHIYYSDTSALVKLYLPETGTDWVTDQYQRPDVLVVIGQITIVEVAAALLRAERAGRLSPTQRRQALERFDADCRNVFMIESVTNDVIADARELVERYPLRAYDALQLSLALRLNAGAAGVEGVFFGFVSADGPLNQAAAAEGLVIANPNTNP